MTSYKNEFINWGASPVGIIKPLAQSTIITELPFNSNTSYKDNFGKSSFCEV